MDVLVVCTMLVPHQSVLPTFNYYCSSICFTKAKDDGIWSSAIVQVCLGEATAAKIMAWVKNNYSGKLRLKVSTIYISEGGESLSCIGHVACAAVTFKIAVSTRLDTQCHIASGKERA